MQLFFSGNVKRMHVWIPHEEKEGNIFFMNINEQTVSRNFKPGIIVSGSSEIQIFIESRTN